MSDNMELERLQKYIKIKKLATKLSPSGREAALITHEPNLRYFVDFNNSEGTLFICREKAYLLVDSRYGEAARNSVTNAEVIVYTRYYETLSKLIEKHDIRNLTIEASSMTIHTMRQLEKNILETGCRVMSSDRLDKLISSQRIIKTKAEIEKIRTAQKITEEAFLELLNEVKPGVKESKLAFDLEYLMRKKGASGVSFDLITIAGRNTSMPHGVPSDNEIKKGDFVTFDIGSIYESYHSDMTRTVAVGKISDKQREVYETVLKAQRTALAKVRSGIKAYEIDRTARAVIARAGYSEYFTHSTGHGVGLDIHEEPFVSPRSETLLSEGMVITVEPGIYLPGEFGVRIEDMAVVTKDGCDNLASITKELIEL